MENYTCEKCGKRCNDLGPYELAELYVCQSCYESYLAYKYEDHEPAILS